MMPAAARLSAAALLLLSLPGCDSGTQDYRHQLHALGTLITLDFYGAGTEANRAALGAIEAQIREIDNNWYPWRKYGDRGPGELQRINTAIASGRPIEVSAELADLLRRAAELELGTGGRFNPAMGRLTELWGFNDMTTQSETPPPDEVIRQWLHASVSSAQLEWEGNLLRSTSREVMLDLGGIAKGALLEQLADIARTNGIENAIIDIGGDLTVIGRVHGKPARIGIRSPRSSGVMAWLLVDDGETVVTSGDYERFFEYQGRRYQHVLDPTRGYPVEHTISATVVHRDPVLADAAATALLVAGAAGFSDLCTDLGLREAVIVTAAGDLSLTFDMQKRLHWTTP